MSPNDYFDDDTYETEVETEADYKVEKVLRHSMWSFFQHSLRTIVSSCPFTIDQDAVEWINSAIDDI